MKLTAVWAGCLWAAVCPADSLSWSRTEVTGRPPAGTRAIEAGFAARNNGEAAVRIRRIRSSCPCITAIADQEVVAAGGLVTVTVTMNLIEPGRQQKSVFVETDAGVTVLTVTAEPPAVVSLSPEQVEWRGEDAGERQLILTVTGDTGAEIAEPQLSAVPGFLVRAVAVQPGRLYHLFVRPDPQSPAVEAATLVVRTKPDYGNAAGNRVFLWRLPAAPAEGSERYPKQEKMNE